MSSAAGAADGMSRAEHAAGTDPPALTFRDLGRMGYAEAYQIQTETNAAVLAARESGRPVAGVVLFVEHDPVITISRRAGARTHLVATPEMLEREGVEVAETDRGGDITYHGPGQLVAYPILDLDFLGLRLHEHMRLLEQVVIDACATFGVEARRDPGATGVWVRAGGGDDEGGAPLAKIAAMGVRVRKWVSMHGLALNVSTNLRHFQLIVPCGLVGRPVTSLEVECPARGRAAPTMEDAKAALREAIMREVGAQRDRAVAQRGR
ncbi:MAG: lipoyl(octanoyl) transferase LipB [Phycisphaerales bacterium]|jgi:lipoyl(octanoyl) transferase|nr:lipoyl(octanoyl) transferase LipB [Phycisphaerales bacterium]